MVELANKPMSRVVILGYCRDSLREGKPVIKTHPRGYLPNHLTNHLIEVLQEEFPALKGWVYREPLRDVAKKHDRPTKHTRTCHIVLDNSIVPFSSHSRT